MATAKRNRENQIEEFDRNKVDNDIGSKSDEILTEWSWLSEMKMWEKRVWYIWLEDAIWHVLTATIIKQDDVFVD